MKKVLICGVIAAAFGVTSAIAGTDTNDFKVTATVTASCKTTTGGVPVIAFGAIPAFSTGIPAKTADLTFKCTLGLSPVPSLSKASSVVAGFAYNLEVDTGNKTTTGVATDALNTTAATADEWTFKVKATILDNQPGDPTAATSDTQTLTVTF